MKRYVNAAMCYCIRAGLKFPMTCNISIACKGVVSIYFNDMNEVHFVDTVTLMRISHK